MGVVLEFALVLVLLALGATAIMRMSQRRLVSEREAVTERRVDAYMATIRREGGDNPLAAMSDEELRDLLLSSARNLRIENDRRLVVLLVAGLVALLAAILVATQNGVQGFGIALAVGAVVLYGINEILVRKSREPLLARGIDVERLRVE
jgi:hypothetical protein